MTTLRGLIYGLWRTAIYDASLGDFAPLIKVLQSDEKIPREDERDLRDVLAAILADEIKRGRGQPAKRDLISAHQAKTERNLRSASLIATVNDLTEKFRREGVRGPQNEAFHAIATARGIKPGTVKREYRAALSAKRNGNF